MPPPSSAKDAAAQGANPGALTRGNLQQFTAAERREHAHQRGRSTPSPEPDFHSYRHEDFWVPPPGIPADVRARANEMVADLAAALQHERPLAVGQKPEPVPPDNRLHCLSSNISFLTNQDAENSTGVRDDPPARAPPAHSNPDSPNDVKSSDAFLTPDQEAAHRSILQHRPNIPRQTPPQHPPPESPTTSTANPEPQFPPNFPAYHCTQNMNEIAAYLANASYVAALGGPPLADLKYGIIVVPVGEESLLFGRAPDFVASQEFLDAVDDANRDYDRALRMHDPDKDSEEFKRGRFEDGFGSVSVGAQRNVEVGPGREGKGDGEIEGVRGKVP